MISDSKKWDWKVCVMSRHAQRNVTYSSKSEEWKWEIQNCRRTGKKINEAYGVFKGHPIKTLVIQSLQRHLVRCHQTQPLIIFFKIQLLGTIKELTGKVYFFDFVWVCNNTEDVRCTSKTGQFYSSNKVIFCFSFLWKQGLRWPLYRFKASLNFLSTISPFRTSDRRLEYESLRGRTSIELDPRLRLSALGIQSWSDLSTLYCFLLHI